MAQRSSIQVMAARAEPFAYAALRVVSGALFTFHGMQKVLGVYAASSPHVGSQIWVGGVIELVGGALIAIGLFTRCAAFVCSGQMAVAYTQFHWKLAFAGGMWLPAMNKGELAVVYSFVFLYVAARGGGRFAVGGAKDAQTRG